MELLGLTIHPMTFPISDQLMIAAKISSGWLVAASAQIVDTAKDLIHAL